MLVPTLVTAVSLALGLSGAPARTATHARVSTEPSFFITGRGWGHGIGLSQYGAYGYALRGFKWDRIVTHYYKGTTVAQAPVRRVRVLLARGRANVKISSKQPFAVTDGEGNRFTLQAGAYTFGPGFKLKVEPTQPPQALPGPLLFEPGAAPLAFGDRGYRGSLRVIKEGTRLQIVNVVGLEPYLWGVVPSEMPKTWAAEALKAQAVVARSYAVSRVRRGGTFDLFPDTRSQVYLGIRHEAPSTTAAVNATAGKVVVYGSQVADTLFFSTSGGRTAAIQDVWPRAEPIPYLVSVADPFDGISPYHAWGPFRVSPAKLARRLKVPGRVVDVQMAAAPSGRVRTLTLKGTRGQVSMSGYDVRQTLGLRSSWFRIAMLSLSGPAAPVAYGTRTSLAGVAKGARRVQLQALVYGETSWRTVGSLMPRGGRVTPVVRPRIATSYRIVADGVPSAAITVAVAPTLRMQARADRTGFLGTVRPAGESVVQIQRQAGSAWRTVATAEQNQRGGFNAVYALVPGTYRAVVPAGGGFVTGVSPVIQVAA
jgi:stage II sporulation protein D